MWSDLSSDMRPSVKALLHTRPDFTDSVVLWPPCDMLRTSGFVDGVVFSCLVWLYDGAYGDAADLISWSYTKLNLYIGLPFWIRH